MASGDLSVFAPFELSGPLLVAALHRHRLRIFCMKLLLQVVFVRRYLNMWSLHTAVELLLVAGLMTSLVTSYM